jgi:hypothetical protein
MARVLRFCGRSRNPNHAYQAAGVGWDRARAESQLRNTWEQTADPTRLDLVTKKRLMFAYEQEVRIVLSTENDAKAALEQESPGRGLDWIPETNVESIRVHPEADAAFMETVEAVVEQYAPALKDFVAWSDMNAAPPF